MLPKLLCLCWKQLLVNFAQYFFIVHKNVQQVEPITIGEICKHHSPLAELSQFQYGLLYLVCALLKGTLFDYLPAYDVNRVLEKLLELTLSRVLLHTR